MTIQKNPPPPVPGKMTPTSRIQKVRVNTAETETTIFLTIESSSFHIWDLESQEGPIFSYTVNIIRYYRIPI
jgi:hypothetical protein